MNLDILIGHTKWYYKIQNERKKMLPFERIVKDVEVKKLSIETHKTLHTRDFRINIIFRVLRIYHC